MSLQPTEAELEADRVMTVDGLDTEARTDDHPLDMMPLVARHRYDESCWHARSAAQAHRVEFFL